MAAKKWNTEQYHEECLVSLVPMPARIDALRAFTGEGGRYHHDLVSSPPLEKSTETERIKVLSLSYELRAGQTTPNNVEVWAVYLVEHKTVVDS